MQLETEEKGRCRAKDKSQFNRFKLASKREHYFPVICVYFMCVHVFKLLIISRNVVKVYISVNSASDLMIFIDTVECGPSLLSRK